jgi:hypothetical protein
MSSANREKIIDAFIRTLPTLYKNNFRKYKSVMKHLNYKNLGWNTTASIVLYALQNYSGKGKSQYAVILADLALIGLRESQVKFSSVMSVHSEAETYWHSIENIKPAIPEDELYINPEFYTADVPFDLSHCIFYGKLLCVSMEYAGKYIFHGDKELYTYFVKKNEKAMNFTTIQDVKLMKDYVDRYNKKHNKEFFSGAFDRMLDCRDILIALLEIATKNSNFNHTTNQTLVTYVVDNVLKEIGCDAPKQKEQDTISIKIERRENLCYEAPRYFSTMLDWIAQIKSIPEYKTFIYDIMRSLINHVEGVTYTEFGRIILNEDKKDKIKVITELMGKEYLTLIKTHPRKYKKLVDGITKPNGFFQEGFNPIMEEIYYYVIEHRNELSDTFRRQLMELEMGK